MSAAIKKARKPRQKAEEQTVIVEPNKRAKKEKKPIQVVAIVTSEGIEGSFTPEPRRSPLTAARLNLMRPVFNTILILLLRFSRMMGIRIISK